MTDARPAAAADTERQPHPDELTDEQRQLAEENLDLVYAWLRRFRPGVYRRRNEADVEDIIGDLTVDYLRAVKRLDPTRAKLSTSVYAYLRTGFVHNLRTRRTRGLRPFRHPRGESPPQIFNERSGIRSIKEAPPQLQNIVYERSDHQSVVDDADEYEAVRRMIAERCPPRVARLFIRRFLDGVPAVRVAREEGISVPTLYKYFKQAFELTGLTRPTHELMLIVSQLENSAPPVPPKHSPNHSERTVSHD